ENFLRLGNDRVRCGQSFRRRKPTRWGSRWSRTGTGQVSFPRVRQHRSNNRLIPCIKIHNARPWVRAADGIVAEEIEHWSIRKVRRAKVQGRHTPSRAVDAVAELAYVA